MLINATPHPINLYYETAVYLNPATRKFEVTPIASPYKTIPPSGKLLNAHMDRVLIGEIEGIPIEAISIQTVDNPYDVFPQSTERDTFIVSAIYANAAVKIYENVRVLMIGGAVFDDGKTVGCTYLIDPRY